MFARFVARAALPVRSAVGARSFSSAATACRAAVPNFDREQELGTEGKVSGARRSQSHSTLQHHHTKQITSARKGISLPFAAPQIVG